MMKIYTVYSWVVKQGRDKEFVAAWQNFARWTMKQKGSTKSTRLFRDSLEPNHFMSVDSWESEKALKTLREGTEFEHRFEGVRFFLDSFSSWPLKLEAEERA